MQAHWELFDFGADIGKLGSGASRATALEQAALTLTAVVTGSHVPASTAQREGLACASTSHGAGRAMSHRLALQQWPGLPMARRTGGPA